LSIMRLLNRLIRNENGERNKEGREQKEHFSREREGERERERERESIVYFKLLHHADLRLQKEVGGLVSGFYPIAGRIADAWHSSTVTARGT
jgi:hypothetical protein